jgi:hypothetical protein
VSLFILGLCDPPDGGRGSEVEMRVMHPPVIVRTYQDKTREQASRRFERDAEGLDRAGYAVASVATNPATSVLYWWAWPVAKVSITVTYVRRLH